MKEVRISSYKVDSVACFYVSYWTQRIFDDLLI